MSRVVARTNAGGVSGARVRLGAAAATGRAGVRTRRQVTRATQIFSDVNVVMCSCTAGMLAIGRFGALPYQRRQIEKAGLPEQVRDHATAPRHRTRSVLRIRSDSTALLTRHPSLSFHARMNDIHPPPT